MAARSAGGCGQDDRPQRPLPLSRMGEGGAARRMRACRETSESQAKPGACLRGCGPFRRLPPLDPGSDPDPVAAPHPASPPVDVDATDAPAPDMPAVMAMAAIAMMPVRRAARILGVLDGHSLWDCCVLTLNHGLGRRSAGCRSGRGGAGLRSRQRGAAGGKRQQAHHERSTIHLELLDPTLSGHSNARRAERRAAETRPSSLPVQCCLRTAARRRSHLHGAANRGTSDRPPRAARPFQDAPPCPPARSPPPSPAC